MAVFDFERVLDYERLPIDAQDIVTKARVVIAGQADGDLPHKYQEANFSPHQPRYLPIPIVVEYEHPTHVSYQAERSFSLPPGVDPFLPATSPLITDAIMTAEWWTGPPSNLRDGNMSTNVEFNTTRPGVANPRILLRAASSAVIVGCRLVYTLQLESTAAYSPVRLELDVGGRSVGPLTAPQFIRAEVVEATGMTEVTMIAPRNLDWSGSPTYEMDLVVRANSGLAEVPKITSFLVHEFYPLIVNSNLVRDIAKAQVRLPVSTPRRVVVRGYLPPGDLFHTITGWPGGDYTGKVARQTYRDMTTIIDFEQAGAPPGLSQEALEAERVRLNRTEQIVRSASYPTLIGRR